VCIGWAVASQHLLQCRRCWGNPSCGVPSTLLATQIPRPSHLPWATTLIPYLATSFLLRRYFVSDFEREGQWLAGGGLVPLSRAVCCRPCLPKELPQGLQQRLAGHNNVTIAVAIVSIGCHKSTAPGGRFVV